MKSLELNQMEQFKAGQDVAACIGGVASGVGVVLDGAALIVGVASGPLGWAVLAIGVVGLVAAGWNGDPCEDL